MGKRRRRYEGALAVLAFGVLMTAACNRLPPGGLFAPGAVDDVVFAARRLDYLQHATGNGSGGGPLCHGSPETLPSVIV